MQVAAITDWSAIGSFVLGLGGLALAALTQWLAHKERSQAYRQALYQRQLDSYVSLSDSIGKVVLTARAVLMTRHGPLTREDRAAFRSGLESLMLKHVETMHFIAPFIPSDLASNVYSIMQALYTYAARPEIESRCDKQLLETAEPLRELEARYSSFTQTLRKHVGVEPLTATTLAVFEKAGH
jgi:hypothetical protein